jgi:hypothetical protein
MKRLRLCTPHAATSRSDFLRERKWLRSPGRFPSCATGIYLTIRSKGDLACCKFRWANCFGTVDIHVSHYLMRNVSPACYFLAKPSRDFAVSPPHLQESIAAKPFREYTATPISSITPQAIRASVKCSDDAPHALVCKFEQSEVHWLITLRAQSLSRTVLTDMGFRTQSFLCFARPS